MKSLYASVALLLLAACGADGPPVAPNQVDPAPQNGVTISGDARLGVVKQIN